MKKRQVIVKEYVEQAGAFLILEYVRYFKEYTQLCFAIFNALLDEGRTIILSQFYDESQGQLSNSFGLYQQVRDLYGYLAVSTKGIADPQISSEKDNKYYIHFRGQYNLTILQRLLRFGGDSLPFVLYGVDQLFENWFDRLMSWNKSFLDWFYYQVKRDEVFILLNESDIIFFASDDWFGIIIPCQDMEKTVKLIGQQCNVLGIGYTEVYTKL